MRISVVALCGIAVLGLLLVAFKPQSAEAATKAECEVRHAICLAPCEGLSGHQAHHCRKKCDVRRARCIWKAS